MFIRARHVRENVVVPAHGSCTRTARVYITRYTGCVPWELAPMMVYIKYRIINHIPRAVITIDGVTRRLCTFAPVVIYSVKNFSYITLLVFIISIISENFFGADERTYAICVTKFLNPTML